MSPISKPIVDEFKRHTRDMIYSRLLGEKDAFEFCKAKCRTSSNSVIGENKYRSVWKHCYGGAPPPLQIESRVVDQITISERKTIRAKPTPIGGDEEVEDAVPRRPESKRALSMPDIELEHPPQLPNPNNPDDYTLAAPLAGVAQRRATSAGTVIGKPWWLASLAWSRSDFSVALYVGVVTVLLWLRSLL